MSKRIMSDRKPIPQLKSTLTATLRSSLAQESNPAKIQSSQQGPVIQVTDLTASLGQADFREFEFLMSKSTMKSKGTCMKTQTFKSKGKLGSNQATFRYEESQKKSEMSWKQTNAVSSEISEERSIDQLSDDIDSMCWVTGKGESDAKNVIQGFVNQVFKEKTELDVEKSNPSDVMPNLLELLTAKTEHLVCPKSTIYELLNEPSDDENDCQMYIEAITPQQLSEFNSKLRQATTIKKTNSQSMWERNQEFLQRKKEKLKQIEQQNKASFKPTINKKSEKLDRKRQMQMRVKPNSQSNLSSKEPLLSLPLSSKEVRIIANQQLKATQPISQKKPISIKIQSLGEEAKVKEVNHECILVENLPPCDEKWVEQSNKPSFLEFPTDNDCEETDEQPQNFELLFDANCSFSGKK